ncbi:MAG TPA: hypothetical protein VF914_19300 [Chloroflexia bacterium]|jgi:hypothetical protein
MTFLAQFNQSRKALATVALSAVLGGALALVVNTGVANSSSHQSKEVQHQGWGYTLDIKDAKLDAVAVHYDVSSPAGIEAYAAAQRKENEQFFKSGAAKVTAASVVFNRALTWDEADAFVRKYGLYANLYEFYGLNTSNPDDIYSFALGLTRDGKSTQAFNDGMRELVDQRMSRSFGGSVTLMGVAAMQVDLDKEQYKAVSADAEVYLIEMSNQVVKSKIKKHEVPQLQDVQVADIDGINVTGVVGPLYRNMVKNHMMK